MGMITITTITLIVSMNTIMDMMITTSISMADGINRRRDYILT